MRYLPYAAASSEPNVIVAGMANDGTLITLSHWRRSGTPADLIPDTSTAIVFNYPDRADLHVPADVVSNNHFDEDGLVGIYALLEPEAAVSRRDLLIGVAQAGDFGVCGNRRAARITFAISAHADPARSPFPRSLFNRPAPQVDEGLYRALLDVLPRLLADVDEYRSLWGPEEAALTNTEPPLRRRPDHDRRAAGAGPGGRAGAGLRRVASDGGAHAHGGHPAAAGPRPARGVPLPLRELGSDGLASAGAARRPDCAGWRDDPRGRGRRPMALRGGRAHHPANVPGGGYVEPDADIGRRLEAALRADAAAWNPYG